MQALKENYELGQLLGVGGYAEVKVAKHKPTGKNYAAKLIRKTNMSNYEQKSFQREIEIMKKIHHPHVVSFHEMFEDAEFIIIIMDLVQGGDLLQRIEKLRRFSETDARNIIKQVLIGLKYVHEQNVCHRDLKMENLLVSENPDELHIFIADFGLSRLFGDNIQMETQVGSLEYTAPEVLEGKKYDKMCDLWSMGVITFILLTGGFPFFDSNQKQLVTKIKSGTFKYGSLEGLISADGKDFISKLLQVDPKHRLTIDQALQHQWILSSSLPLEHNKELVGNLRASISKKQN